MQNDYKEDYCQDCGKPLLYTDKPCPNCTSGFFSKGKRTEISLFQKIIYHLSITIMVLWSGFCFYDYIYRCSHIYQLSKGVINYWSALGYNIALWLTFDIWYKPMIVLGLIAIISKPVWNFKVIDR